MALIYAIKNFAWFLKGTISSDIASVLAKHIKLYRNPEMTHKGYTAFLKGHWYDTKQQNE